ncbi:hypothetical protein KIN20_032605 [Parelaphostrongylus tenuis]|uniref:Uncharacterized protein n=1 Tax=Parelaphostrongylus tenuis TaxID=148309 RepID=A0AAD5R7B4_PARTN|nr:hypothetical protein KIN20_032605 [Parelaphostrongylus tenuis]
MQVYYAPNVEKYTKTVIDTEKKEIVSDDDDFLDDEAKFSDDEKEKEYKARKMKSISCSEIPGRQRQKQNVRFSDSAAHRGERSVSNRAKTRSLARAEPYLPHLPKHPSRMLVGARRSKEVVLLEDRGTGTQIVTPTKEVHTNDEETIERQSIIILHLLQRQW